MQEFTRIALRRFSQALLVGVFIGGVLEFGFAGLGGRLQSTLSNFDYAFLVACFLGVALAPFAGILSDDGDKISIDTILRITIGCLLIAVMFIGYFVGVASDTKANSATAILLSAILATMGWWLSNTVTMRNARAAGEATASNLRKQHTLNVLFQFRRSETFERHQANILRRFPIGTAMTDADVLSLFDERKAWTYFKDDKSSDYQFSPIESIAHVANFYEAIAAGIKNKDLDELLVKDTLKTIMIHFHYKVQPFIVHVQRLDSNGNPTTTTYEHYTALVKRWRG